MIPNFWCSFKVATAELDLCFVMKGNVWWKRTFRPMVTIIVLHHTCMKLFKSFTLHHMLLRGPPEKVCFPNFLAYLSILCFERLYPKQNTDARLKSSIYPIFLSP